MTVWGSWAEFGAMGGYGLYVWGSLVMSLGGFGWELLTLAQRRRRAIDEVRTWRLLQGDDA